MFAEAAWAGWFVSLEGVFEWLAIIWYKAIQVKNLRLQTESTSFKLLSGRNVPGFLCSSVQLLSHVSLFWLHGLQHTRLHCPSPTPRAYSNSCPSSWWCHPTISSSVVPFSSCLQSFLASGCFQMSQFFISGGQILEFQLQHHSFQWIFRTDFL